MLNNQTIKELIIFCIIGFVLLVIDFGVYSIMYHYMSIKLEISKGVAYIFGTLVSFYLNKKLTFKKEYKHNFLIKFIILYCFSFVGNVMFNTLIFNYTENFIFAYIFALFIAVAINFIGQKFWVFK